MDDAAQELFNNGIDQLRELGLEIRSLPTDHGADGTLGIGTPGATQEFDVHLKQRPTSAFIYTLGRDDTRRSLVIAGHMPDQVAELARHFTINYIDTAGNMFIRGEGLLLDVRGRPPSKVQSLTTNRSSRVFKASGLQVVFVILTTPDGVNSTYRDLASSSGVSLGTVQGVLTDLEKSGYLSYGDQRRHLHRIHELFDKWVDAYLLNLHHRLTLARFEPADPTWWARADQSLIRSSAQWGGEIAAHRSNPRLRPKQTIIYTDSIPSRLVADNRLKKADDTGSVEFRRRFWRSPTDDDLTVPSPLIYADLMASADPRLLEAAADLRKKDALLQRIDRS